MTETIVLGGGCFWCTEAVFLQLRGVTKVVSGYAGGHVADPTYDQVCGKRTGHAEVVQVTFDPAAIGLADILRVFFTTHDPTTPNAQGADHGPQYRSIVLYANESQKHAAENVIAEITRDGVFDRKIVTEIDELETFWPAEPEHQDYYARNPWAGYCRVIIAPKVAKFRKAYQDRLKQAA